MKILKICTLGLLFVASFACKKNTSSQIQSESASSQDYIRTDHFKVYTPQAVLQKFGERLDCNAANLGKLAITMSAYSSFAPIVEFCVKTNRFGSITFSTETARIPETLQVTVKAALITDENDNVVYYLLGESTGNWSGCHGPDSWPNGNGNISCPKPANSNIELAPTEQEYFVKVDGKSILVPYQNLKNRADYPNQTLSSFIDAFRVASLEIQSQMALAFGSRFSPLSESDSTVVFQTLTDWRKVSTVEDGTFFSAVGNLGTSLALPFAEPLLASDKLKDIENGVMLIRRIPNMNQRLIDAVKKVYPKSVDQGTVWADWSAQSVVRMATQNLKSVSKEQYDELVALQNTQSSINRDLNYWLSNNKP